MSNPLIANFVNGVCNHNHKQELVDLAEAIYEDDSGTGIADALQTAIDDHEPGMMVSTFVMILRDAAGAL